jgi:hypothetical protein
MDPTERLAKRQELVSSSKILERRPFGSDEGSIDQGRDINLGDF